MRRQVRSARLLVGASAFAMEAFAKFNVFAIALATILGRKGPCPASSKRRGNRCHDGEAYRQAADEVVARVGTSLERGLASDEAHKRLQTLGANELSQEKRVSRVALFLAQFKNTLVIILLVATVLSAVLGEIVDAAIIAVIVLFCAVLSFVGNIVRTTRSRR